MLFPVSDGIPNCPFLSPSLQQSITKAVMRKTYPVVLVSKPTTSKVITSRWTPLLICKEEKEKGNSGLSPEWIWGIREEMLRTKEKAGRGVCMNV